MSNFVNVGSHTLNLAEIAHVEWADDGTASVFTTGCNRVLFAGEAAAELAHKVGRVTPKAAAEAEEQPHPKAKR